MSGLNQFAEAWLDWIWAVSWQFTLLVGLVAIACWLLRSASARLRHALWLLCLLKILIPPSLAAPWGLGNWGVPETVANAPASTGRLSAGGVDIGVEQAGSETTNPTGQRSHVNFSALMLGVWAVGGVAFWIFVCWRYLRLSRAVASMPQIDEGPLRVGLERLAQQLKIRSVPDLHITDAATSPYLLGLVHPRLVLPQSLIDELDADGVQTVLLHELIHWRRRDTWIGWGQVFVQGLLWIHPLVWWVGSQLRNEREIVCDDAVVRFGSVSARQYGEVILRVLTATRGRSPVAGSLVGVFERGAKLQQRLEDVMSYDSSGRRFGWGSWVFLGVFALLALPMGSSERSQADSSAIQAASAEAQSNRDNSANAAPENEDRKPPYPVIVSTDPVVGATEVSASLSEIKVTFDRDMGGGMSWTGGGPQFPQVDKSRKPYWVDQRTCVLPVSLKRGQFYRVGINSTSFQNFKSANGTPAPSSVIHFVTLGANQAIQRRVRAPEAVELDPANNATDVDPATSTLRVTFNMPMGESFSWTGGGENFPEVTGKPYWSKDGKTCTLPVKLESGHEYALGLNSLSHINFQSKWGVPLKPVAYTFKTKSD